MDEPGGPAPLGSQDFLYVPSTDVAADLGFYEGVLGGEVVFAIEAMETRVAEVRLTEDGPRLLLADHLHGEAAVFVYRVEDLDAALADLESKGLQSEGRFGIPHGPIATLRAPGGQRMALYQLTRPEADEHFAGRRDF